MIEELQQSYGNQFEPALIDEIKDVGILMEVADGHDLIKPGQYIKSMPPYYQEVSRSCAQMLMAMNSYSTTLKRRYLCHDHDLLFRKY
jgi:hypothetical protein